MAESSPRRGRLVSSKLILRVLAEGRWPRNEAFLVVLLILEAFATSTVVANSDKHIRRNSQTLLAMIRALLCRLRCLWREPGGQLGHLGSPKAFDAR